MTTTSTAVIYARYSSHNQREVSIDQQVRACTQFAERHSIEVVKVYSDRAISGTSDKRPEFQQMVQDAKHAGWNYVIVYTLDRFARDRYDSAVYKRQLKNMGVKVLSAMENISDDPTGILMESILEGLAEYYSKELSRKVLRGHEDNARKCMVNGVLPLGYVRGSDGRYQISEPEAAVVREIYQRVRSGEQQSAIMEDLNSRGITTRTGKPWVSSSLGRLLTNERYTGVYIYRDIRIPDGIPQIVPPELFWSVQDVLHSKPNARMDPTGRTPQKRRRENGVYLLTGKLFCGHCKSPMVGVSGTSKSGAPHFYYTCKGHRADHSSCSKRNIRRDAIEQFVAASLRDVMLTSESIQALATAAIDYQSQQRQSDHELASLKSQLTEVARALANLTRAIEAGIFSATTQERLLELEAKKQDLTRKIASAEAEAEQLPTREEIIAMLELFKHGDIEDKDYQETLIDTFLVAAYVYDDRVKFVFNLNSGQTDLEVPFDIDTIALSDVRIPDAPVHQHCAGNLLVQCFFVHKASRGTDDRDKITI